MRAWKRRLTAMVLAAAMAFSLLPVGALSAFAAEPNGRDIYVSADGDDTNNGLSAETPFATLAKAVEEAEDGATIYVMSNLTMDKCARFYNKTLTIEGLDEVAYTVTRGDIFAPQNDPARGYYNPAMIEVQTTGLNSAGLTLRNIVFDDAGKYAGTTFAQAVNGGTSNTDYVQDAIIASNATNPCTIVLDNGAVLKNYGGMSAVRVTSAAKLVMSSGSKIWDDTVTDRIKGEEEGTNGPAGAVWVQGGNFSMENGAEISDMVGRAVYVDGGNVRIDGTIQNITSDPDMWQGDSNGIALHLRSNATAVLGPTGKIENISGTHASYRGAVVNHGGTFTAEADSVISGVEKTPVLYSNYGTDILNGTIENCANDFIIGGFCNDTTIDTAGVIQNCTASGGAANSVVYTSNASKITLNGTVKDNIANHAFYIINHSGGGASLIMNEGAVISGTGKNDGVYINASESSFTMNGGTISNFETGVHCRGKYGRDATFIMNDGTITGNSVCGLLYDSYTNSESIVKLNGGTISGNGSDYQIRVINGAACDQYEYIEITEGVIPDDVTVNLPFGLVTLDTNYSTVRLGQAKSAVKTTIETKAAETDSDLIWTAKGNALYIRPENAGDYHFTATRPDNADTTDLYIAYIPLDANGSPETDGELTLLPVYNTSDVDVTMENLEAGQAYGVVFINSDVPVKQYEVTFELDGGTLAGDLDTTIQLNAGERISREYFDAENLTPPEDTPELHFLGWYKVLADDTLSETAWKQSDRVLEDITLRAKWGEEELPPEPDEPERPAPDSSDGCFETLLGVGIVLAGGAAALTYHYRDFLPIWKYVGIVKFADDTPVPDATVTLIQDGETVKTVTTNDDGYFETRVPKGDYEVVVTWTQDGAERTERTSATVDRVAGDIRPQEIILSLDNPNA